MSLEVKVCDYLIDTVIFAKDTAHTIYDIWGVITNKKLCGRNYYCWRYHEKSFIGCCSDHIDYLKQTLAPFQGRCRYLRTFF